MPLPGYVICSRGVSTDRDTNFFSLFDVFDKLIVSEAPAAMVGKVVIVPADPVRITSTWHMNEKAGESFEDDFEFSLVAEMEDGGDPLFEFESRFKYLDGRKNFRITLSMQQPFPVKRSGDLLIHCRTRKEGIAEWSQQTCRLAVEYAKADDGLLSETKEGPLF